MVGDLEPMLRSDTHRPLLHLKLDCGYEIFSLSLHLSATYAGLLEGRPGDEANRFFLEGIPDHYQRVFGDCPVFVIPPLVKRWREPHPNPRVAEFQIAAMPRIEVASLFESWSLVGKSGSGSASALIVVWHQDEPTLALTDDIRARLAAVDWAAHAKDFWH